MRKSGILIAVAIVFVGGAFAWLHFNATVHNPLATQATSWAPYTQVSSRQRSMLRVIRQFGPWHLGCSNIRGDLVVVPKVAPIQNLALSPGEESRTPVGPCFVQIVMRKAGVKIRFLSFILHATDDGSWLRADVNYFMGPLKVPTMIRNGHEGGQDMRVDIGKAIARPLVSRCPRSICTAQFRVPLSDLAALNATGAIVFRPPPPPGVKLEAVRVPVQGLKEALAALREQKT
jgi:hypothetical protein